MRTLSMIGYLLSIAAVAYNPLLFGALGFICLVGMFAFEGKVKEDEVV